MLERLKDALLGAKRYCWQVRVAGKPLGYLCESYEMFEELIRCSNIPPYSKITVHQVYARYKKPKKPPTKKLEPTSKSQKQGAGVARGKPKQSRSKSKWRWNTRGSRHRRH